MLKLCLITRGPRQTEQRGEELGRLLTGGEVISLSGDLGVGKTLFAKGLARGMGIKALVKSPTFSLINEYPGEKRLFHFDLFRIKNQAELSELGFEEYLYRKEVSIIEWGERADKLLPPFFLEIKFFYLSPRKRKISFLSRGEKYQRILSKLPIGGQKSSSFPRGG